MINSFPGYEFIPGKTRQEHQNLYKGENVGVGGYVYFEPGMYQNVALIDSQSHHPSSAINMNYFGEEGTKNYKDIYDARVLIKHKEYDKAKKLLGGALSKYLDDEEQAEQLSKALKLPLNSTYGISYATFQNAFVHPMNENNIIACRGALFMVDLKEAVQKMGHKVIHVKTDSIKVPNATPEIIKFIQDFGKEYGYIMEHEATYSKLCLVNGSTYVARYNENGDLTKGGKHANDWTATAAQFQQPYVFKTLFSHEPITFKDMCEIKEVKGALYLDFNEDYNVDEHNYHFVGKVGEFCPILPGCGGGELLRFADGKYSAATGTKGYRWLESEMVKELHKEDCIDKSYYTKLVDEAVKAIEKYGDFEWFVSDDDTPLCPQDE